MLSILIPVYNFDICALVADLHAQCERVGVPYEILCFDDGSASSFKAINSKIITHTNVVYKELPVNLGRSKIRNALAEAAAYDYLLFMDCDSKVVRQDYINHYIKHLDEGSLLYGGRVYDPKPPREEVHYFHWQYGINREQVPYSTRWEQSYHSFMTNNFLIPKSIFTPIGFDDRLTQYGHEDTIFGLELQKRQVPIIHLDNPLEHLGLESTAVFLQKTKKGIENLYFLYQHNPLVETKLLRTFIQLKEKNIAWLSWKLLKIFQPIFTKNLHSKRPQLLFFDLYKLGLLLEEHFSATKNK